MHWPMTVVYTGAMARPMIEASDQMLWATPLGRAMPMTFLRSPPSHAHISARLYRTGFCFRKQ